jgi:EF-P beta-lysylation protein EpmB
MRIKSSEQDWQSALKNLITDPDELFSLLELTPAVGAIQLPSFNLRVPRSFVARMQKNNWQDPLLQQVLPVGAELLCAPGYTQDPLQEQDANKMPGLLHKYRTRVLLLLTGACAIHCRYCFRRHFPYSEQVLTQNHWRNIIEYLQADPSIQEVIYSGGDPLMVRDKVLAQKTADLAAIPHIQRLRIHTRLPIVIPERINSELLAWLQATRLRPVVVVHCNHANEIDAAVIEAMQRLREVGVTLLNQAVLLQGINDDVASLVALSEKLFAAGVLPYYLHSLDPVAGAAHFAVTVERAKELLQGLMEQLPGYLVPKLVKEEAGRGYKLPL